MNHRKPQSRYYEATGTVDAIAHRGGEMTQTVHEDNGTEHFLHGIFVVKGAEVGTRVRLKVSIGRTGAKCVIAEKDPHQIPPETISVGDESSPERTAKIANTFTATSDVYAVIVREDAVYFYVYDDGCYSRRHTLSRHRINEVISLLSPFHEG